MQENTRTGYSARDRMANGSIVALWAVVAIMGVGAIFLRGKVIVDLSYAEDRNPVEHLYSASAENGLLEPGEPFMVTAFEVDPETWREANLPACGFGPWYASGELTPEGIEQIVSHDTEVLDPEDAGTAYVFTTDWCSETPKVFSPNDPPTEVVTFRVDPRDLTDD